MQTSTQQLTFVLASRSFQKSIGIILFLFILFSSHMISAQLPKKWVGEYQGEIATVSGADIYAYKANLSIREVEKDSIWVYHLQPQKEFSAAAPTYYTIRKFNKTGKTYAVESLDVPTFYLEEIGDGLYGNFLANNNWYYIALYLDKGTFFHHMAAGPSQTSGNQGVIAVEKGQFQIPKKKKKK